jgi:hypothetical protein
MHVASPLALHAAGDRQVPVWQVNPVQQSLSLAQVCALPRQVHTRLVAPSHSVAPQHCSVPVHVEPTPRQHLRETGDGSQRSPAQQSATAAQPAGSPAIRHAAIGLLH